MVGIAQAQAFLDGNKRAAFGAFRAFLGLNGYRYVGEPLDLAEQLILIAERRANDGGTISGPVAELEAWLRPQVVYLAESIRRPKP
jgi:prophage maintenance system killer protein